MIAGLPQAPSGADRAGLPFGAAATAADPDGGAAAPFCDMFVALLGARMTAAADTRSPSERAGRGIAPDAEPGPTGPAQADDEARAMAAVSSALLAFLTTGSLPPALARRDETADAMSPREGEAQARVNGVLQGAATAIGESLPGVEKAGALPTTPTGPAPDDPRFGDLVALAQTDAASSGPVPAASPEFGQARSTELTDAAGAGPGAEAGRNAPPAISLPMAAPAAADRVTLASSRESRAANTSAAPSGRRPEAAIPPAQTNSAAAPGGTPVESTTAEAPMTSLPTSRVAAAAPATPDAMRVETPAAGRPVGDQRITEPPPTTMAEASPSGNSSSGGAEAGADRQPTGQQGGSQRRAGADGVASPSRRPIPAGIPLGLDPAAEPVRPTPQAQEFRTSVDSAAQSGPVGSSSTPGHAATERAAGATVERPAAASMTVPPVATSGAQPVLEIDHPLPHVAEGLVRGRALDDVLPTQIVQSLRMQWAAGTSEATVQLRPEYLGELTVSIKVEQGAVVTTLHAESAEVRRWIEANTATLREALAEHGLRLERVVVREPADSAEGRGGEPREDERPRQRRPTPDQRRRQADDAPTFQLTD